MKLDYIKEIVLNEEILEDNKNYTIKSFPKKENINNFIITYKVEINNKGKTVKAVSFDDSGDRIIKIYNTDNSIDKLDSKDLMSIKESTLKKSIMKAINLLYA